MAPLRARAAVWLAILLHAFSVHATSAFWTYTTRYQMSVSTRLYTWFGTETDTYTVTGLTRTIMPSVVPTAKPFSTSMPTGIYAYSDLELHYEWYTAGAVAESQLLPDTIYGTASRVRTSSTYTYWSMGVTWTPPATCASQFTFSTTVMVNVPTQVQDQMKPTSVVTGTSYVTGYLSDGAAPYESESNYYYTRYILSCSNPTGGRSTSPTGRPSSTDNDNDNINYGYNTCYYNCNVLKVWVIVIAVIIPTIFLLGFLESWIWFRRLMTGRSAMRFGTISWICMSLWVACFTRFQSARSQNDQKLLREKWKAMSGSTAFKLWWKWGFKHRYPTELLGEYSRNDSGVPGAGPAVAAFSNEKGGPPPPAPPPFINHNGVVYIPQSQQSPYAPQATSYLDCGGVIYVPQMQTEGYAPPPSTVSSHTFTQTPPPPQMYQPPQTYQPPQAYSSPVYNTSAPPTAVSSLTHSPHNQYAQPAPSEVSGVSSYGAPVQGQVVYTPPAEVGGQRPGEAPEWVPPRGN